MAAVSFHAIGRGRGERTRTMADRHEKEDREVRFTLTGNEQVFLRMVRGFDFLRKIGYSGARFGIYSPEPGFVMEHLHRPRSVSVSYTGAVHVAIGRQPKLLEFAKEKSLWFSLQQVYSQFGSEDLSKHPQAVDKIAAFMQEHLVPVLDGRMWIDDLLRKSS